mmetsp:Transcript_13739/g.28375  ORF Transcript_13739/g.28375 Transcript_13739/m.28375 type:complete len:174 (-) Transcript_13739:201-722(-)
MCHRLLKKKKNEDKPSRKCKIWISCLHTKGDAIKRNWVQYFFKKFYCYILDKYHSGNYPNANEDQLVQVASLESPLALASGPSYKFRLVHRKDTTMDYYMTSILEPTHFGKHEFKITPLRLFLAIANLFLDPNAIQRMIWYSTSDWMFQFNKDDISKSDMIHWWLLLEEEEVM